MSSCDVDDAESRGCCCGAICMAPILIVASFATLISNEKNTLAMHRSLDEAVQRTIHLNNISRVDPWDDGDMIHAVGMAITTDVLADVDFGVVSVRADLKLRRSAEMYQWEETRKRHDQDGSDDDDNVYYEYHTTWADHPINSHNFHDSFRHENPDTMPFRDKTWTANPITLGAFTLPESMVSRATWFQKYGVSVDSIPSTNPYLRSEAKPWTGRGHQGIYLGDNPNWPRIGDERIWYDTVPQGQVSICAVQRGATFEPYVAEAGKEVLLFQPGNHTIQELYRMAHSKATTIAYVLRALGFVLLWIGLRIGLGPLAFLAEHVPLLGPCLGQTVGCFADAMAALVALVLSGTIVVVSWIGYRMATWEFLIPLVVVVVCLAAFLYYLRVKFPVRDTTTRVYPGPAAATRFPLAAASNNNLPSYKAVPCEAIPEAQATIVPDDPERISFQTEYPVAALVPSAPPAYMDERSPNP